MGIEVVCAFILQKDKVWMGRRPPHKHMGGRLEFPGGKVDAGETQVEALKRELLEELRVEATVLSEAARITFQYPEKIIHLTAYFVEISGDIQCVEHTEGVWIELDGSPQSDWAPADVELWNQFRATRIR
ncbi:(deoxy)nucleoside triphosphate pyrophosphohydrolase [Phaeocystidibacter luteus]|uniref:(Deoxy)nucleoside triphosphate pyrophosphohydrolase n=1 Tax=Phaeocystidibacter luteus TaxID=911197 RepID=A0A6N6RG44_9FLAO|nr:(deoxy)nucleoside triphosphate pyrophosphohydrolase [Phaeocystidibacter luteus]KAB2810154.1 (deoxy)nucleoside triphosphate pyrophosphohydrolase [Phaeocystidibacter luteus]